MGLLSFFKGLFSSEKKQTLEESIADIFQVNVQDRSIYEEALIHRSVSDRRNNERLEYLGDAVLDLIVADLLFTDYPELKEGELTKLKSKLVSRENFRSLGRELKLAKRLPIKKQHDLRADHIIGNLVESLYGAIYVDQGYEVAKDRALDMFRSYCNMEEMMDTMLDPKSELLEWSQKHKRVIRFETREGQQGGAQIFRAKVLLDGSPRWEGEGSSKKRAQMEAARKALDDLVIHTS